MCERCCFGSWILFLLVISVLVPVVYFVQLGDVPYYIENQIVDEFNLSSGDFFVSFDVYSNVGYDMDCYANYSISNYTEQLSLIIELGLLNSYEKIFVNESFDAFYGDFSFDFEPYCLAIE
jgi:hypothetical protein